MDLKCKKAGAVTPAKDPHGSKISNLSKISENFNPNVRSPGLKFSKSPTIKSATKTQKPAPKNPNPVTSPSPRNQIRERKFVVAIKNSKKDRASPSTVTCKCKVSGKSHKCVCVAYESLRASHEEFFKNKAENEYEEEKEEKPMTQNTEISNGREGKSGEDDFLETNVVNESEMGSTNVVKRRRDKLLEVARESVPESGCGRVLHLVKAFENLLSIPTSKDSDQKDENGSEDMKKGMKWALPGLQPKAPETQVSSSSFCPSEFLLTSENLGLDSPVSSSLDSSQGSISSRTSGGGQKSRRNSSESSGNFGGRHRKRRQHKVTSHKPFKLRTEQRGMSKEEEFIKKVQQMMMEEEKQRIPIAQGLPWTTDEPECLAKPRVKEITRPTDLLLHSHSRAVERAEFDHQMAEKMILIEQYRAERERQNKLTEEEEIRRLRMELVPRAQPMPYFDRPFIPIRSVKHPTIPKKPRFHVPQPQQKKIKCSISWIDMFSVQQ